MLWSVAIFARLAVYSVAILALEMATIKGYRHGGEVHGRAAAMFEPGAMSHRNVGVHGRGKWQSKQSTKARPHGSDTLWPAAPGPSQPPLPRGPRLKWEQLSKCPWGACVSTPEGTDESEQCRRLQRQASKASGQRRSTRSRGARDVEGVIDRRLKILSCWDHWAVPSPFEPRIWRPG